VTSPVVLASGLRKSYGSLESVRGLDLEIAAGETFALLGPNGAGKTTIVEMLAGLRDRSGGELRVLGADPWTAGAGWREAVGIVMQESSPDPGLTVRECVDLYSGYYSAPRPSAETIELVGLADSTNVRTERLSGGQRRRLDVGLALVGRPRLLFLDEPTTGFDPAARHAAWRMIDGLRDEGVTIVLTTHAMDEAERLADTIAIVVAGSVVAAGTPDTIGGPERGVELRFKLPRGVGVDELVEWAIARGIEPPEQRRPELEDVYLELAAEGSER
jgi:ABC-2 type transport system ATP-binding protein